MIIKTPNQSIKFVCQILNINHTTKFSTIDSNATCNLDGINLVKSNGTAYYINQIHKDDIFAWLENQDKEVDVIENFDTEFEKQVSHLLASALNKDYEYTEGFVKWVSSNLLGYAKYEIEKQGRQMSV